MTLVLSSLSRRFTVGIKLIQIFKFKFVNKRENKNNKKIL